jgi:hypothetical protein
MQVVYLHAAPNASSKNDVFYVGRGSLERAKRLTKSCGRNWRWQRKAERYGHKNIEVAILECSTFEASCMLEIGLIKLLRQQGVKLANISNGGESGGTGGALFHGPHTDEAKRKMSESRKGKPRKPRTPEWNRKISEALTGRPGVTKGMKYPPQTEEHRRKNSQANKKVPHTKEWNQKVSEAKKLRKRAADYFQVPYRTISKVLIDQYKEIQNGISG